MHRAAAPPQPPRPAARVEPLVRQADDNGDAAPVGNLFSWKIMYMLYMLGDAEVNC